MSLLLICFHNAGRVYPKSLSTSVAKHQGFNKLLSLPCAGQGGSTENSAAQYSPCEQAKQISWDRIVDDAPD